MQRSVAESWRPSWSRGAFALSFPPSSPPTRHPNSSSSSIRTLWHPYTLTAPMSFSCCSLRLVHIINLTNMTIRTVHPLWFIDSGPLCMSPRSLICLCGWMKPIPCFRREPVCWSWSTELSVSAGRTPSLNFSRLFIFSPNTGPGFCDTTSPIITVIAYVFSWPVSSRFKSHLSPAMIHLRVSSVFNCVLPFFVISDAAC